MDKSQNDGFTLIELMITLAVLAIIIAIAAPAFSGLMERRQLQGAGEKLFADLMFAKTEAIKRNTPIRVSFTGNGATWCYGLAVNAACDCTANDCVLDGVLQVTSQDDYNGVSVAVDSTLDGASTTFTPLRGAADTGHLQFTVTSGADLGAVVSSFGRVRMCSDSGFNYDACP
jgi:prepilin-type N-terminal cleavage/methylation domain-containing protein